MTIRSLFSSLYSIRKCHCRIFIIVCCCVFTTTLKAQTAGKIAFIDHSRVRSEYKALQHAKDSLRTQWKALQQPRPDGTATDKKAWHDKHAKDLQQYEIKIIAVIREVAAKGGFTDIKPITKGTSIESVVDITDAVLQKLNTKN